MTTEEGMEVEVEEGTSESRLFVPFKTLGLVSNEVPIILRYIHKRRENFIISSTGRAIQTFVGQQLKLISTTDEQLEISCVAGDTYNVYTVGKGAPHICAWRRGTELVHKYDTSDHKSYITHLLPFAENLISVDWDGVMCVFDIKTEELIRCVTLPKSSDKITTLMHPLTYQNKILIGHSDGQLHLWNINSSQLIHQFETFRGHRINVVVQAPARGVVAVGLSNSDVVLFNFEFSVIIMRLSCLEEPMSIAFRTDGHDVIIVGGSKGSVTAWDLNSQEMISYVNEAHNAPVTGLVAFMAEPIFVTSGADNALRVWIFDKPDGGFRLLNTREGHRQPPTMARFHGEESPTILTTGMDNTLRNFHLYNETYNRIISNFPGKDQSHRGVSVNSFNNYGGYHQPIGEDIVAFNKFEPGELYTFSYLDCKRGKSILAGNEAVVVTCAQITSDQQWAIVGLKDGRVQIYNLQSKRLKSTIELNKSKHGFSEVMGVALSATESAILVGSSKTISFHEFPGLALKNEMALDWPVRKVFSRAVTNLCGVVLANFEILVCDVSTYQVVRRLKDCCSPITDATFSPDMKWVSATTSDGCVLTFDVVTGNLIDIFRNFPTSITSVDYSPRGDFLITTHADEVGLKLWINRSVFEVSMPLVPIPQDYYPQSPSDVIPFAASNNSDDADTDLSQKQAGRRGLISLGVPPKFHWKELLNLNSIKARNKPAPAFKPKRSIPFILSDLEKEKTKSLFEAMTEDATLPSSIINSTKSGPILLSSFGKELTELFASRDALSKQDFSIQCDALVEKLVNMGPSQIDLEVRSWDPDCGGDAQILHDFLQLACVQTKEEQHLQIVQACLALFHKLYHKEILKHHFLEQEVELLHSLETTRGNLLKSCSLVESLIEFSTNSLY